FDPERSRMLAEEGDALFAEDNFRGALDQYTLGLEYDSTYARNALGKARAHFRLGEVTNAIAAYDLTIELGTDEEGEPVAGMTNVIAAAEMEKTRIQENQAAQASAQELADKVTRATGLINAEPLGESAARTGYDLLEEARLAGYDSSQVAYHYAKALNVLGEYEDATHYATLAVDQSEGQPDRSAFFIQLGLAHMGAGNTEEARMAFEATAGGAWEAWGTHYLGQLEEEDAGG
ncbi:MAG: hypothetical protein AAF791_15640, partial [Bacteroidota bacterium]